MGHSGSALLNRDYVEVLNPASWSALGSTRIELSFAYDALSLSSATESAGFADGEFKGLTFAFPVSSKNGIGAAMGLIPYSRLNYEVEEKFDEIPDVRSGYTSTYKGKGGIAKIFIGGSYKLPFDLHLGATLDYYFGKLTYNSITTFDNTTYFSSDYELYYTPRGFGTSVGLITPDFAGIFNSESISDFRFALAANIFGNFNTDTLLISTSSSIIDTLGSGENNMNIPLRIISGASIAFDKSFILTMDYIYQAWTNYEFGGVRSANLKDLQRASLGFEYRPKRVPGMSFWEQIMVRFGLSYEQSQYNYYNTDMNQYSVNTGFSIPLSPENTVDLGFEYAVRGSTENNLFREDFFRINLGISFGDIWFERFEY
jgi:hypothetical protein